MRDTFSSLLLQTQNYVTDPNTTSDNALSDTQTFLKREVNLTVRQIRSKLKNYRVQKTQTAVTVADQLFYHNPPDMGKILTATLEIGGVKYPLRLIDSYSSWNNLNQIDFSGSTIPQYIFPREADFGIWPKPTTAGLTITLTYNATSKDMTADDYNTGTVAVTNNNQTVTGSGTTFTAAMVNRWFRTDDDNTWYRIGAFGTTTSLTLESVFEGTTDTSSSFVIGESPDIPEELHEFIPWGAAAAYLAGPKRNPVDAQAYLNYYWTGDFNNSNRRAKNAAGGVLYTVNKYNQLGRGSSALVNKNRRVNSRFDEVFSSTLTTA